MSVDGHCCVQLLSFLLSSLLYRSFFSSARGWLALFSSVPVLPYSRIPFFLTSVLLSSCFSFFLSSPVLVANGLSCSGTVFPFVLLPLLFVLYFPSGVVESGLFPSFRISLFPFSSPSFRISSFFLSLFRGSLYRFLPVRPVPFVFSFFIPRLANLALYKEENSRHARQAPDRWTSPRGRNF